MGQASKPSVLFLCTKNSCRSQMAEGWCRQLKGDRFTVFSAGIEKSQVDPRAARVMAEARVDISRQNSKQVSELNGDFDYVVTVCDAASEQCPISPAKTRVIHAGFEDPPKLARNAKSEEEALSHYRRIRDEIRGFVEGIEQRLGIAEKKDEG
ncbi:MAG: arsenate reductase ArsC [Acidobacteria bacterium]|nr:MAG: arsenate reductase ArsC [Acidobacteriota bacterium]